MKVNLKLFKVIIGKKGEEMDGIRKVMFKIKVVMGVLTGIGFLAAGSTAILNEGVDENSEVIKMQIEFKNPCTSKKGTKGWATRLSEDFETGVIPSGWKVIDGNIDGFKWTAGTTPDLGSYTPPNYGTAYVYYSDDDAGNGGISYNEELWTPAIFVSGMTQVKFKYGYGFRVRESGEKYRTHFRKFVSGSWTDWTELRVYTASGAGTDSFDLTDELPCDSIQFRFFYSDSTSSSHWGYACAVDNVIVEGFVPANHDAGVAEVISPKGIILIGYPVSVIVKYENAGNNSETFPAIVRIFDPSNALVFSKDTNLTLGAGQTIDVNFGQWTPTQTDQHFIYGKTMLTGDEYPQNDSLGIYFWVSPWTTSWVPYTPPTINSDRLTHATVYDPDNDKIYMIGGRPSGGAGSIVPYIYRYDPVTDSWETNLTDMPGARGWIQGGYWNGKIYVPGGYTNSGTNSNTLYIYDIASNLWTTGPNLPEARMAYGLAVWNGNIYVIGGVNPGLNGGTQTVFRYNVSSNQWTQATQIPMQFDMGGSCYLGDTIYLVGGLNRATLTPWTQVLRGIIDNQNPDNITWEWITDLPYANFNNATCALQGKVYMIGGFINGQVPGTNRVWEYDIATNEWRELPQYVVPIVRNHFACTRPQIGGNGARIYVVAGDAYGDWGPPNNYYYYLERAVGVSEEACTEKSCIFFVNPNIGKGPFSIYFTLKNKSNVDISIYNLLGQKIDNIYRGKKGAGNYMIKYDGNLNSGIYFIILKTSKNSGSYRIIKIK
ncbi:MAG: kelch repeat-containing protein [candidate division WOR-3 bacterium]